MAKLGATLAIALAALLAPAPGRAQEMVRVTRDSVSAQFVDADLRNVVQAMARYLPKPVLIASVPSARVSLETPTPIPRAQVLELLRGMLEANNLELLEEETFFRVREKPAPQPAAGPVAPSERSESSRRPSQVELFVVRLRHARAADVAATVGQLFGASGGLSSAAGLTTGTLSDELRRSAVPPVGAPGAPEQAPGAGRTASLSGAVTIVPDEITNALLIRASRADYDVIQTAVAELDIRPLQVMIEVLIVEARRDNIFTLSADLFLPEQVIGGTTRGSATVSGGGGLGDLVVRLLNVSPGRLNATINAAESRGNVHIVSRPIVVASNNVEARLLVGAQRPFVQVSRSLPTDAPQRDQVVQYRDVGTRLVVRPTINHDGYVSLQIQQEVNAATEETQFDAPVISTRETATRVLVRNRQTIVLGGLRDTQRSDNRGGVPIISRIPILGGLFGHNSRRLTDTELFLFITPTILATDADADSVTAPRLRDGGRP